MFDLFSQNNPTNRSLTLDNKFTKKIYHLSETLLVKPILNFSQNKFNVTHKSLQVQNKKTSSLENLYNKYQSQKIVKSIKPCQQGQLSKIYLDQTQAIKKKFRLSHHSKSQTYKKMSQIEKWDAKIQNWRRKSTKIMNLMPPERIPLAKQTPKVEKVVITLQKIQELIEILIKNIQFFWNIFQEPKKMTNYLKQIEGFNKIVKQSLFKDELMQRIMDKQTILNLFQISKPQKDRLPNFIQKDIILYNSLHYYSLKMDQRMQQFGKQHQQRAQTALTSRGEQLRGNIKKVIKFKNMQQIQTLKFLKNKRIYLPTYQKDEQLKQLETLGVKFDIHERMKDKVLNSRERIAYKFGFLLNQITSDYIK